MTSLRSKTYIRIIYYLISGWTFLLHSVADFMNDSTKVKGSIFSYITQLLSIPMGNVTGIRVFVYFHHEDQNLACSSKAVSLVSS